MVYARSRRSGPLHRWLMDGPATSALPARSPAWPRRDARRAPAVLMPRRSHDLDLPGVRCGGVRAAADRRLPDSRWRGSGALAGHAKQRQTGPCSPAQRTIRSLRWMGGFSCPAVCTCRSAGMGARRFDGHLSVTTISDATPPQTRDSHASPWMRSAHITVSPAVPTKGLP